jgi:2-polyprenyl-3-methyl-5-hydroxy-6-metoxy-1,4-benzoquinol methylase
MSRIISEDGPWTAHPIQLTSTLNTMDVPNKTWEKYRANLALSLAMHMLPLKDRPLTVLDVGCLEGGISIALAQAGCSVVGLEIRESSLRKARFAAEVLELGNVQFIPGDMLKLDELNIGRFDLIVCAGTLYHVDAMQIVPFLSSLNRACHGICVIDTHVAMQRLERYKAPEVTLHGRTFGEHFPDDPETIKEKQLWASGDNPFSFWLTERSLANALTASGFSFVMKPLAPLVEWPWQDRHFWVAYASSYASTLPEAFRPRKRHLPEPDLRPLECPSIELLWNLGLKNPHTQKLPVSDNE